MKFQIQKKFIKEAIRKVSFFFGSTSGEWSNAVSLMLKHTPAEDRHPTDLVGVLDILIQNPTESFQTLVVVDYVEDFEDEEIVVDGLLLSEIISKSTSSKIEFDVDYHSGLLTVTSDSTEWTLPFLIKSLHRVKLESEAQIWESEELSESLKRVKSSIGLDIGRPYLMMANIVNGRLQACDGFKLQETRISNKDMEVAIPAPSIQPLLRLLESDEWKRAFAVHGEGRVTCFKTNTDKFCFVNPKSKFPDLTSMIVNPMKSKVPSLISVDKRLLIGALEQVAILSDKDSPQVLFDLESGGKLTLSCHGKSGFKAQSSLKTNWSGAGKTLCFDIKSLLEVLKGVKEEKVEIRFSRDKKDEAGPIVVESENLWSMVNQMKATK